MDSASSWSWVTRSVVTLSRGQQPGHGRARRRPQTGVERAEGFVEQHQRRLAGQRPGQCDALLLAAGQLVRSPLRHRLAQLDGVEQCGDPGAGLAGIAGEPVGDVLPDGQVREQRAVLGDVADVATVCRYEAIPAAHLRPAMVRVPPCGTSKPAR